MYLFLQWLSDWIYSTYSIKYLADSVTIKSMTPQAAVVLFKSRSLLIPLRFKNLQIVIISAFSWLIFLRNGSMLSLVFKESLFFGPVETRALCHCIWSHFETISAAVHPHSSVLLRYFGARIASQVPPFSRSLLAAHWQHSQFSSIQQDNYTRGPSQCTAPINNEGGTKAAIRPGLLMRQTRAVQTSGLRI